MLEFIVLKMCKCFLHTLAISIPFHSRPVALFVLDAFRLSAVQSSITCLSLAFPHPLLKFQLIAIDSNCETALRCRNIHSLNAFMRLVRSLISAGRPTFPTAAPPIFASNRQFSLCSSPFYVYYFSLSIIAAPHPPLHHLSRSVFVRLELISSHHCYKELRLSWGATNSNKRIYCSFARADETRASREKAH